MSIRTLFREEGAEAPASSLGVERAAAVVEAALGYVPENPRRLMELYRMLAEETYRLLLVLYREDEPEPSVIELRCLEPQGPTARAEELGLVLDAGGRRCVVYPG